MLIDDIMKAQIEMPDWPGFPDWMSSTTQKKFPLAYLGKSNKKEKKMHKPYNRKDMTTVVVNDLTNTLDSIELRQRSRLENRLWSLYQKKVRELEEKFNINSDPRPRTYRDLIKRIEEKKYVIHDYLEKMSDEELKNIFWFGSPLDAFEWRDPSRVKDEEGFGKAFAELKTAYENTLDDISVLPVAEGLKSLRKFQS